MTSASRLARLLFLVGHCAVSHLALVDAMAKRVRRERLVGGGGDPPPAAEEEDDGMAVAADAKGAGGQAGAEDADIAAQIGMGAQAAVRWLDRMGAL